MIFSNSDIGEYVLLCIKKYHESNNESPGNICLIPYSAHGTNFIVLLCVI